jgi:membrane associated rhomboid family serine protease
MPCIVVETEQLDDVPERVLAGVFPSVRKAHEHGLVALSQGAPYWVEPQEDGACHLLVAAEHAGLVAHHLRLYEREQRFWPPLPLTLPDHPTPLGMLALWALCLGAWHLFIISSGGGAWFVAGRLSAHAVIGAGAWWQVITALTLHADWAHLAANAIFGGGLYYILSRSTGAGLAILIAVFGGAAGNALNAWFHYPEAHFSVGASTAVFAIVGCLAAMPLGNRLGRRRRSGRRAWLTPLLAGVVMLGWFGAGGDGRTDVSAHLFGFSAGLPLGLLTGAVARDQPFAQRTRRAAFWLAAILLLAAWASAV